MSDTRLKARTRGAAPGLKSQLGPPPLSPGERHLATISAIGRCPDFDAGLTDEESGKKMRPGPLTAMEADRDDLASKRGQTPDAPKIEPRPARKIQRRNRAASQRHHP